MYIKLYNKNFLPEIYSELEDALHDFKIDEIEFCLICGKVLREEHICQGQEDEDNKWK